MKEPAPGAQQVVINASAAVSGPETEPAGEVAGDGVVRLFAEQLSVGKRLVEGEGVQIHVTTEQEEATAAVSLRTERIEVERVPVGRVVDATPSVREEDDVTIIPVMEEIVVTEIRLVLKEELHVRRVADTREHRQTIMLRHQRAELERLPATGKAVDVTDHNSNKDRTS